MTTAYTTRRERRLAEEAEYKKGRRAAAVPEPKDEEELKRLIEEERSRVSQARGRRRADVPVATTDPFEKLLKDSSSVPERKAESHPESRVDEPAPVVDHEPSEPVASEDPVAKDESSENLEKGFEKKPLKKNPLVEEQEKREGKENVGPLWRRLLTNIGLFCLYTLIAIIGFTFLSNYVIGLPLKPVISNSMSPALERGDLIVVSNHYNSIGVGDVITYEAEWLDNKTVVHRVIAIENGEIFTQGDNNPVSDPPFTEDKIEGEMVATIPMLGYLFNYKVMLIIGAISYLMIFIGASDPLYFIKKLKEIPGNIRKRFTKPKVSENDSEALKAS